MGHITFCGNSYDEILSTAAKYGFDLSEKAVRRAGLDYWKHVKLKEYNDWEHFLNTEKPAIEQLHFFENDMYKNF